LKKSFKKVDNIIRMLQKYTNNVTKDERTQSDNAKKARLSYDTETHPVIIEKFTLLNLSLRREK
jgi:hypothetical protein